MERRSFLKKFAGYSLGIAAGGLLLPRGAKCEIVKPFAEMISGNYLDEIIRKRIAEIKKGNPNLKLGDMHCHSYFSDGAYRVEDLMFRAASIGLDFLVITEHLSPDWYTVEDGVESIIARRRAFDRWDHKGLEPPRVYPALEVSAKEGHLIAVFPEEYSKPRYLREIKEYFKHFYYYEAPVETVAKLTRKMNGVTIVPHPNIQRSYPFGISSEYVQKNLTGLVDAIEDMSSGHSFYKDYSTETGLASIGSSDDHLNILIGTTVTQFDQSREENILEAIRKRETTAVRISDLLDPLFAPTKMFFSL